jgi:hypothetical protein
MESNMTLRDGSEMQDYVYIGNGLMRGQVWVGKSERDMHPVQMSVPLGMLSDESRREVCAKALEILQFAA